MYIKLVNGQPEIYTFEQLRQDNPNTSFSKTLSNEILEKFAVYPYVQQEIPTFNEKTQKLIDIGFINNGMQWIKSWNVVEKSQEEIENWIKEQSNSLRAQRNFLLSETDYLALSDNTLTQEMAAYRQALRDITTQSGFPETVVWPIKPA